MAPIDWGGLMALNPEELDGDRATDMVDALEKFDPEDEEDAARLKKLFEVTRYLMVLKTEQAILAEDAMAEMAEEDGKAGAKKDQELMDMKNEVEELRRQNKDLKLFGGESTQPGTSRDVKHFRDELADQENQIRVLERAVRDKDKTLYEERQASERFATRAEDAEKEVRELKRENDRLHEDIRDIQRQMDALRESMMSKQDEGVEYRDMVSKKNRQLSMALEENRNLAEANEDLEVKLVDMKRELRDGRAEIEKTTDDYLKLKLVVTQSDHLMDALRRDNEMLRAQLEEIEKHKQSQTDMDDAIMAQVDRKVEEWKRVLQDKDAAIVSLEQEKLVLREQLIAANMDSEKTSVAALTKALEERDQKIASLKRHMEEAMGDMEANTVLMEDFKSELNKSGKGPKDHQTMKMTQLANSLRLNENRLKDAVSRAQMAEEDARAKDRQLSEALERMRQYEAGEYGLAEAVIEIKDWKLKIDVKDRQVEDLTQYINKVEMQVNDLCDENEDLRDRLGLPPREPIDLTEFKKKKGIRMQEDRALNRVLQKEVERLEEERIEHKQTIRKLAQATGQKAVALGLTSDDMQAVDNFIEELKAKKVMDDTVTTIKQEAERDELRIRAQQLGQDLEDQATKIKRISQENAELKAKNKEIEEENAGLEKGMREIHKAIKEADVGGSGQTLQCPTLDKMLLAIEAKHIVGRHDTNLYLKAQADNLTGHNEELRQELKEIRFEATKAKVDLEKSKTKVESLQDEVKALRDMGAGVHFQTMPLPEGMAVTSSDVIASLNEHLIHTLQELSLKDNMVGKMEESLDNYKRKFAVMRHQQGLLYQDYVDDKKRWDEEKDKLEKDLRETAGLREEDAVKLQEFDRLLQTLSQDEVEVRRRLADSTRKMTVLRVNEKALTRRYSALHEMEQNARKDNSKLKNDMIAMETAVQERLGYLQRYKDISSFKLSALQKALDESVPAKELEKANVQFTDLTEKYRDLLEKSNNLVVRSEATSGFEIEVKRLQTENEAIKGELEVEKEKLHTLEAAFENMRKQGVMSSRELKDSEVISISHKLTTLEMKELNERQRADHAARMYDQQKKQLRDLEDRNFELEQKFAELTRMNLDAQKTERELRDELSNCVTKAVSDVDRAKITQLDESVHILKIENAKLKDIAEVASTQSRALDAQQTSRDKEVTSLRQQLLDFQSQSDEKTVIGRLHRQVVQLQVSEGTAVRRLEDAMKRIVKLEAQLLRAEQRIDDKDTTIYHNRLEARSKSKHLKNTIQDMRRKFTGAVPLQSQEKFAQAMIQLQEEKKKMEEDLKKTAGERLEVEDKLAELELQHRGLQDLIATLKDGHGAQKVAEWHGRMEQLRLEDLRLKRQIDRAKQQIQFLEGIIKKHEKEVQGLEEDKVKQAREFEVRELEWEQREVELERIIANMERQQAEIAGAASQFEEAVGSLPDPSWPVAKQLDHAVATIKMNVKMILDTKAEAEVFKKHINDRDQEIKNLEKEVTHRDRVITELRLRLPATAERDAIVAKVTAQTTGSAKDEDYETSQAVRVAQTTVHSLQARVHQKEETLQKYQELLRQARADMQAMNTRHETELKTLHEKLHSKNDAAFVKFKQAAKTLVAQSDTPVPTNPQLKRLNELEDIVAEQDNSIAGLREKLTKARQEIQDWRYKYEDLVRTHADEKDNLLKGHGSDMGKVNQEVEDLQRELSDKQRELDVANQELETQKEANTRAPTTTMKNMIERLRNQVALKEKQHKALSKALMELRADMVTNAQEEVKAHADHVAAEQNVQRVVNKHTKEYQDQVEELQGEVQKFKKVAKKYKDKESSVAVELEEAREDVGKLEKHVKKLKADKGRLEGDVEELEKKVERMSTMQKQRGLTDAAQHELEELRRKNRHLEQEVKRSKHQAEKPYEQMTGKDGKDAAHTEEVVARWEESKKWQKMVERLKGRVKDKDGEIEKLHKANETLRNVLDRANKDKENLELKLRQANRSGTGLVKQEAVRTTAVPPVSHNMEELKRKNYELEEEVNRLRRQLTLGPDAAMEEVKLRNQFLAEKLEILEHQVAHQAKQDTGPGSEAYKVLADKEQRLQKEVIRLNEEAIEIKFELEQARRDIPRLKARIEDLQKYVDVLKTEKEQLQMGQSSRSFGSSLGSPGGNIRRIGESGKSSRELEKTVALLKKVVERTQAENEQLKKAPGVVNNEQVKFIQNENHVLKSQLEELRHKMGSTLSERYVSQQKGTAKIMADHETIRKDLAKEQESNERLRVQVKHQTQEFEQLQRTLDDTKKRLAIEEAKKPSLSSMDAKGWKSVVITRMYEEKLKCLEEDVEKKNKMLGDVKVLLREAAEREQDLVHDKHELEQKVALLERFPPGIHTKDPDLMQEYQLSRLKIDRLENEKKELLHELHGLRKRSSATAGGPDDVDNDEIIEKIASYDKLMEENIEIHTQLKSAELDRDKLQQEVTKLRKELSNFGPEFFEEIEDLKYNYREAVQKNVQYEDRLAQLSRQFGIDVNIPGL